MASSPVRTLLDTLPWGHTCKHDACECPRWHPVAEGTDLILALWDRQFLNEQMSRTPPAEATSFHLMVRIPATALPMLHGTSGQQGFYVEPRLPDGRTPDPSFAVIWLPQTSLEDLRTHKATDGRIVALARLGRRQGLRVAKADAPAVWTALRPGLCYVDPDAKLTFHVGPLPKGINRTMLQGLAKDLQWPARPLQSSHTTSEGTFWTFISNVLPPKDTIVVDQALVTIVQVHDPVREHAPARLIAPKAATAFLKAQTSPPAQATDPLQQMDPWAQARLNAAPVATVLRAIENTPQAKPFDESKLASLDARITKLEAGQTHTTAAVANVQTDLHKLQHKVDTGFADFRTTLTDGLTTLQQQMTMDLGAQIKTHIASFEELLSEKRLRKTPDPALVTRDPPFPSGLHLGLD